MVKGTVRKSAIGHRPISKFVESNSDEIGEGNDMEVSSDGALNDLSDDNREFFPPINLDVLAKSSGTLPEYYIPGIHLCWAALTEGTESSVSRMKDAGYRVVTRDLLQRNNVFVRDDGKTKVCDSAGVKDAVIVGDLILMGCREEDYIKVMNERHFYKPTEMERSALHAPEGFTNRDGSSAATNVEYGQTYKKRQEMCAGRGYAPEHYPV